MGSRGKAKQKGEYDDILGKKGKSISERLANEDDSFGGKALLYQQIINPNYRTARGSDSDKYTRNCALCSTAAVLQEMGYDVEAMPRDPMWRGVSTVFDVNFQNHDNYLAPSSFSSPSVEFMGRDPDDKSDADRYNRFFANLAFAKANPNTVGRTAEQAAFRIDAFMRNAGNGAYGEIGVTWKGGGGHSMFIKHENGETKIIDAQTGRSYVGTQQIQALLSRAVVSHTMVLRLDNVPLKKGVSDDLSKMVRRKS